MDNGKTTKTGILTFHWADDYGAMLQAYGLKCALENNGIDAEIVNYAPFKCIGRYWFIPYCPSENTGLGFKKANFPNLKHNLKKNVKHLNIYLSKRMKMRSFRKKYLVDTKPIRQSSQILYDKYSSIMIGSDQVWNPELTVGLDDAYWGKGASKNCKIISYAASLGGDSLEDKYSQKLKELLANFSSISLREKSAIPYVERLCQKKVFNVIDPTLLLDKEEWERILVTPKEQGYILVYTTSKHKRLDAYARNLSQKTGKKIIELHSYMEATSYKDATTTVINSAGPREFLGFFQNADYVVTNSFHGTVFSCIFEKQFLTFGYENRSARMIDLLESLDIGERFVEDISSKNPEENINDNLYQNLDTIMQSKLSWLDINTNLATLRKHSIDFILTNI